MLIGAAGLIVFTSLQPGSSYFGAVLPGAILAGLGMLTKGFQAPVYLAASTVLFLLVNGQWRRVFS